MTTFIDLIRRGMIQSLSIPQKKIGSGNVVVRRRSPDLRAAKSFEYHHTPKILDTVAKLTPSNSSAYCGFDPTADSLHLGHMTVIYLLLSLAKSGYKVIALVGGCTARLGDPSGRLESRPAMEEKRLEHNAQCLERQLSRIFSKFSQKYDVPASSFLVQNNAAWYSNMTVEEYTERVAKHFKITDMVDRSIVKQRMEAGESSSRSPMSFSEFVYPTFQAYDWLQLYNKYKCCMQIGGYDQIGNIEDGYAFIWKASSVKPDLAGITVPLVVTSNREKLGKSLGNAVWLDQGKTTPASLESYISGMSEADVKSLAQQLTSTCAEHIKEAAKDTVTRLVFDEVASLIY